MSRQAPAYREIIPWSFASRYSDSQLPQRSWAWTGQGSNPWQPVDVPLPSNEGSSQPYGLGQLSPDLEDVLDQERKTSNAAYHRRRESTRDEFDGPSQLLDKAQIGEYEPREQDLPQLPTSLHAQEQDDLLSRVNDRLSQCAFDFVANYQFPIPLEPDKRHVRGPSDRAWSEWVYLLKRLATKRRIPARVLYHGQIRKLITILENSLEMRHAAKHQSRPLKDDRNILQLISSGLQVAKILKDAPAMRYLDALYVQTEDVIRNRRGSSAARYF